MDANIQHAISPIHILVDDILEMIFFQLTLQAHNMESLTLDLPSSPCGEKAPAFSQVCRRWRSVALASPRLWRFIVNTRPTFVRELISRSAEMPLVICFSGSMLASAALEILTLLRPQVPRIQVFLMLIPSDLDNTYMAAFFEFLMSSGGQLENIGLSSPLESFDLPLLLPVQAPRLKTLKLLQVSIPWGYANLEGLTSLTLTFATQPPPIATLFRLLHRCSFLEKFYLTFAYKIPHNSSMTDDELLTLPHFELPRLQVFSIIVPGHLEATHIMAHLILPETVHLYVFNTETNIVNSRQALVSPRRCPILQRGFDKSTHAVVYGSEPQQYLDGTDAWTHLKSIKCSNISNGRAVEHGWTWATASAHVLVALPISFHTQQFSALQSLTVRRTFLSAAEWEYWVAHAPGTRELIIMPTGSNERVADSWHLRGLLDVLSVQDGVAPWPHLRTLAVSAAALVPLISALEVCCFLRAGHGAPIAALVIFYKQGENALDDDLLMALERIAPVTNVVLSLDWE